MKAKRVLSGLLVSALSISNVIASIGTLPVSAMEPQIYTDNGTSDIPVNCEVASGYYVILPAEITLGLDTSKEGFNYASSYKVGVIGNIDFDKFVIVKPTKTNDFVLYDATKNRQINPVITQSDISWSSDELGLGEDRVDKDGRIYADIKLAGSYSGEAQFEYYLSDTDKVITDEEPEVNSVIGLQIDGEDVEDGGLVYMGQDGTDATISLTLDGEYVSPELVTFKSTNDKIMVDEDGDIIVSEDAKVGDQATITASIDVNELKSASAQNILSDAGLVLVASAKEEIQTFSFDINIIGVNYSLSSEVDEEILGKEVDDICKISAHPGDVIKINASVEPMDTNISWSKTTTAGSISSKDNGHEATIKINKDAAIGKRFNAIATVGLYSKVFTVEIEHIFDDGEITKESTCADDGEKTYTCVCGETKTETIPTHGHSYELIKVKPTCESEGYDSFTCNTCGDSYSTNYKESIPHDYEDGVCKFCGAADPDAVKDSILISGKKFNTVLKQLVSDSATYTTVDTTVTKINFIKTQTLPEGVSVDKHGHTSAVLAGTIINIYYNGEKLIAPEDCSYMFSNFRKVSGFTGLNYIDTSNVTDMNNMFGIVGMDAATALSIDLTSWDTSKVTDMSYMFRNCGMHVTSTTIKLANLNTSNVTNVASLFYYTGYESRTLNVDITGWDLSHVQNMDKMFEYTGFNASSFAIYVPRKSGTLTNTTTKLYGATSSVYVANPTASAKTHIYTLK